MPNDRVLILGGTREGRELASTLASEGYAVITSLAGATENPVLPVGEVRIGGCGGAEGLVQYIRDNGIAAIADATHPFAARMSSHAAEAARIVKLPLLRLERPEWTSQAGDRWTSVQSAAEAAEILPVGARALVTIGGREIGAFFARDGISGVARMIEPFRGRVPPMWNIILQRPPLAFDTEMQLLTQHRITHLVTKNAGSGDTSAKLEAARELRLPVIMIERPAKPRGLVFATSTELCAALRLQLLP